MSSLATHSYWDSYYAQSPHPLFDWYLPNQTVLHHVLSTLQQLPYSPPTSSTTTTSSSSPSPPSLPPLPTPSSPSPLRLLQFGCGSSFLTSSLAPLYPHITNIDFSPTLIHSLQHPTHPSPLPPTVSFHCLDVRQPLPFPSSSFHLLLDKGTLDCVWLGGGEGVERMLDEAERLLAVGGVMMCFSLYGYDDRMELMECSGEGEGEGEGVDGAGGDEGEGGKKRRRRSWTVQYHVLEGPLELPQQPHTFLYCCTKE